MIEKGKQYRVIEDSLKNFKPGETVVALEDSSDLGFFARVDDYEEGKEPGDYDDDKYDALELNEVEEI